MVIYSMLKGRLMNKAMKHLKKHLTMVATMRNRSGLSECVYSGIEGLLLRHGVEFHGAKVPEGAPEGIAKECFRDAFYQVHEDPERYVYCEGYALDPKLGLPVHHGWVWDKETEKVIDITWLAGVKNRNMEACVYLGIPFTFAYVCSEALRTETFGVLSENECVMNMPLLCQDKHHKISKIKQKGIG